MKIGLVGCGVIGGAFKNWVTTSTDHELLISDKEKGYNDNLTGVKAIVICVPAPTLPSRIQDLSIIKQVLSEYKSLHVPFILRSTVLPGTCDMLMRTMGVMVLHCPEFLTERFAFEDFIKHKVICAEIEGSPSVTALVKEIFKGKQVIFMKNSEAEMAKYAHNCFGALKIHYFNTIYAACRRLKISYESVLEGASVTGFIEPTHTQVPGPDGQFGFGGKCLPKDLKSFIGFLANQMVSSQLLRRVEVENDYLRHPNTLDYSEVKEHGSGKWV